MGNMSLKEKAVLYTIGMVLLYALAVGLWFFSQQTAWSKAAKTYQRARDKYRRECTLIKEKSEWEDRYAEERSRMPLFERDKQTDTTWLAKMDELAAKHHISISQRQAGKADEAGEVIELPIDVKGWEGSLEALVRFVHELENTDDGMFDMRSISFKPSAKRGYLKGSFTLTCAYMLENGAGGKRK